MLALPQDKVAYGINLVQQLSKMNVVKIQNRMDNPSVIFQDEFDQDAWVESGKTELFYSGNYLSHAINSMQIQPGVWVQFMKITNTVTNNRVTYVSMEMNMNMGQPTEEPQWIAMGGFTYVYNANNHLEHMYLSMMNMETGVMESDTRAHYIYENNMLKYMYSTEKDEDSDAIIYEKQEVFFVNNKFHHIVGQTSADSSSWVNNTYSEVTFDPTDNSNYDTFQNIVDNGSFYPLYYHYPFMGARITQELTKDWNGTSYEEAEKETFTFDSNWNVTEDFNQNKIDGNWVGEDRTLITYVNANQINTVIESDWPNGTEQNSNRYRFQYGTGTTDVTSPMSNLRIASYPNPFKEDAVITIKSENVQNAQIELFNVKGRKVASKEISINSNTNINLSQISSDFNRLATGIYFVKVNTGNGSVSKKVIKIK
jgi:hypothetical protein